MKRQIRINVVLREDDKIFVVEMLESLSKLCDMEAVKIFVTGDNVKADERIHDGQRLLFFASLIEKSWEEGTDVTCQP